MSAETPFQPGSNLRELLDALVDGALSSEDHDRLAQLLADSADARKDYAEFITLHVQLTKKLGHRVELSVLAATMDGQQARLAVRRSWLVRYKRAWATLAAGLLMIGYYVGISWNMTGEKARGLRPEARGASSSTASDLASRVSHLAPACVVASKNAKWLKQPQASPPAASAANQPSIEKGEPLELASGLVELKLEQGVTLSIEGPARWSIDGNNRATLRRGRLAAHVPKQASGFTLETPTASIVDLGTEFGVEVDERGHTDTQVFKGEVRMNGVGVAGGRVTSGGVRAQESIVLKVGQAAQVDFNGRVTHIAPLVATREQFIPSIARSGLSPYGTFDPDQLSPYAKYVINETKPVAYWDFSRFQNAMKITQDRVREQPFSSFVPGRDGLPGPSAAEGGFAGLGLQNPALRFDRTFGETHLAIPVRSAEDSSDPSQPSLALSAQSFSVQVWINSAVDFEQQVLSYVWTRGIPGFVDDGMLVGGSYYNTKPLPGNPSENGTRRLTYFGCNDDATLAFGNTLLVPHRWYCVTLVRDGERASIYLDGKPEIETTLPRCERAANQFTFGHRADLHSDLGWQGLLDEVAIWNRALSAEEVSGMYAQATVPGGQPNAKRGTPPE